MKVNEERLLKSFSCLSLKSPIFNKLNISIYISVMLLRYCTFVCVIHILIHYFVYYVAKHVLSLE